MNGRLQSVVASPVLYPAAAIYLCAVAALMSVSCGALSLWEATVSLGVVTALIVSIAVAYETQQQVKRLRLALLEARERNAE